MISISRKSALYMRDAFSKYSDGGELPDKFTGRTIFHLYPTADTVSDDSDETLGFVDVLLFRIDIYSTIERKKYSLEDHDQIEMLLPCDVRIFKDGSTMIVVDKDIELGVFQSLEVRPA